MYILKGGSDTDKKYTVKISRTVLVSSRRFFTLRKKKKFTFVCWSIILLLTPFFSYLLSVPPTTPLIVSPLQGSKREEFRLRDLNTGLPSNTIVIVFDSFHTRDLSYDDLK